jgi:thymidylate synthase (FAD)
MKLIESKVELIEQQPGLEGIYKQIELAGRTCYKSEDKITEDSAKEFVDRMIKSKHGAMLEHGTVYLKVNVKYDNEEKCWPIPQNFFPFFFEKNKYSKVRKVEAEDVCSWYVTTNMRVIVENDLFDCLEFVCEPTEMHEKRITARFTCDRGVSHEIVRHRVMSFAQESQRYVGYDKEKFGSGVTFIKPHWYDEEFPACLTWVESLKDAEQKYMDLREAGLKAQDARGVLPNATKTEIVVTGFESDWEHFFELRTAGAAHPDMRKLALELQEKLNSVNK